MSVFSITLVLLHVGVEDELVARDGEHALVVVPVDAFRRVGKVLASLSDDCLSVAQHVEVAVSLADEFPCSFVEHAVEGEVGVGNVGIGICPFDDAVEVLPRSIAVLSACLKSCLGSYEIDFREPDDGVVVVEGRNVVVFLSGIFQQEVVVVASVLIGGD